MVKKNYENVIKRSDDKIKVPHLSHYDIDPRKGDLSLYTQWIRPLDQINFSNKVMLYSFS